MTLGGGDLTISDQTTTQPTAVQVSIDGEPCRQDDARISVLDHGFLFGDSVYDVVRTEQGIPFAMDTHLDRLDASARRIGLEIGWTRDQICDAIARNLVSAGRSGDSMVRIVVTRGIGPLDISTDGCNAPRLIVISVPLRRYPESSTREGIALSLVTTMRNPSRSLDPSIKSGNYLNNVLALREARRSGAVDAVMLNEHGLLTECTTSNLFFVSDSRLCTPKLECGLLAGITRSHLLDLASADGIPTSEEAFRADDLLAADEIFITSTTKDVLPVARVGDATPRLPVPGPVTSRLMQLHAAHVKARIGASRDAWQRRLARVEAEAGSASPARSP